MMSIALSTRHAELVSASIPPLAPKGRNDEVTVGLYPRQPALWHDLYWGDVEPAGTLASAPHERRSGLHRAICRPQSRPFRNVRHDGASHPSGKAAQALASAVEDQSDRNRKSEVGDRKSTRLNSSH